MVRCEVPDMSFVFCGLWVVNRSVARGLFTSMTGLMSGWRRV